MQITFEFPNLGQAIAAFSKDLTPAIAGPLMNQYIPRLVDRVKGRAPKKSGKLADSIYSEQLGTMEWTVYEGVPYGKWVREGCAGRTIYPVNKKALWWQGLEHPVASAKWPGIINANPYQLAAVDESMTDLQDVFNEIYIGISEVVRF